jgi:hypothetical protein
MTASEWVVAFDNEDMAQAQREAAVRMAPKVFRGTHVPQSSRKHTAGQVDLIGVMGEMAAAYVLGLSPCVGFSDSTVGTLRGNDGHNFTCNDLRIAVCTGSRPGMNMWVKESDPLNFDILIHCNMETYRSVRVVSFLRRCDFEGRRRRVGRPSGDYVWQIDPDGTEDIDLLPEVFV